MHVCIHIYSFSHYPKWSIAMESFLIQNSMKLVYPLLPQSSHYTASLIGKKLH